MARLIVRGGMRLISDLLLYRLPVVVFLCLHLGAFVDRLFLVFVSSQQSFLANANQIIRLSEYLSTRFDLLNLDDRFQVPDRNIFLLMETPTRRELLAGCSLIRTLSEN